jgi:hypothetical protein
MHMAEQITSDWLTARECVELLQCTPYSFFTMVKAGQIRKRDMPGYRRYWREDVERLAAPPKPAA